VFVTGGGGGSSPPPATTGTQSVKPVSADTSGSYNELVQRANGLYDQGATAFQAKKYDQGSAYFEAAAKVYAVAWKQQSTDPAVGTDFATSLFYSGQIEPAVSQVDGVLAKSPEFQSAWFNKGNYLAEKARQAEQDGDAKAAKTTYADARVAYEKAVALGADTASGQQAQQRLDALPQ
jgi:tetratricopeptide (TPR) repeat protein